MGMQDYKAKVIPSIYRIPARSLPQRISADICIAPSEPGEISSFITALTLSIRRRKQATGNHRSAPSGFITEIQENRSTPRDILLLVRASANGRIVQSKPDGSLEYEQPQPEHLVVA